MADETVGNRVFWVRLLVDGATGGRVSQGELGAAVSSELGGDRAYKAASVSEWENGRRVPSVRAVAALARAARGFGVDVDPGWLAFGKESYAPEPANLATVLSQPVSLTRSKRERRRGR